MYPVSGKKGVVIGCGAAGISVVGYLLKRGAKVGVTDSRKADVLDAKKRATLEAAGVEFEFGDHTKEFITAADFVVPSPGVPLDSPVVRWVKEAGIPVLGELGLAAGGFEVPVVAVTGSNGKTTVTSLIGDLLKQHFGEVFVGGNIGVPLLEYFSADREFKAVVLELSSFQLELVGQFRPDISLVLNVTPDHLDRHHTMAAYRQAKLNIMKNQSAGNSVILGGDDRQLRDVEAPAGATRYRFGTESCFDVVVAGKKVKLKQGDGADGVLLSFDLEQTQLGSSVNLLNAAAAITAASTLGCSVEEIERGLAGFVLPDHRMAEVAEIEGVRYINDSKATNIGAMSAALKGCEQTVVLIGGGRDKQGDFNVLKDTVSEKVRHLILIGEAAGTMRKVFQDVVDITHADSMEEAVATAREKSERGDVVLLAPGCASFDMFTGYEQRGEVFSRCVLQLKRDEEERRER